MLLTSVARAEHTAQTLAPPADGRPGVSWSLLNQGDVPVLAEPVRARVRLAFPGNAQVYSLDGTGRRVRRLDAKTDAGVIEIDPAGAASIWCEIVSQ